MKIPYPEYPEISVIDANDPPTGERFVLSTMHDGEKFWRFATTKDQIAKKRKLLERDVELWKKGIRPQ